MVRVGNSRGRMSEWSNIFPVNVETPLEKPSDFQAQASAEGVRLSGKRPTKAAFASFEKPIKRKSRRCSRPWTSLNMWMLQPSTESPTNTSSKGCMKKRKAMPAGPAAIIPKDISRRLCPRASPRR